MPLILRLPLERSTWQRWAYQVVGGALLMPYWILSLVTVPYVVNAVLDGKSTFVNVVTALAVLLVPVPATFITGLVPAVRVLEGSFVRELVGGRLGDHPVGPSRDWNTRFRTAWWFSLHLHVGVLMSAISLATPPMAIVLLVFPFFEWDENWGLLHDWSQSGMGWLAPGAALLLLTALLGLVAVAGVTLDRLAPIFLGPSQAERVAELEQRADRLAERNRLARELHDSVGHALSIVTLQAAAAGRVLDNDPDFAKQALSAIEESARSALEDLDHVLGLLREDASAKAPQPTLADLGGLLDKTRLAGVALDSEVDGGLDQVPAVVSREAYRIVQEGLTNALRHAGRVPVTLRIGVRGDRLEVEMSNPLGAPPAERTRERRGGGRGLHGIRERVTVLRGEMTAGPDGPRWRMDVSLPLRSGG